MTTTMRGPPTATSAPLPLPQQLLAEHVWPCACLDEDTEPQLPPVADGGVAAAAARPLRRLRARRALRREAAAIARVVAAEAEACPAPTTTPLLRALNAQLFSRLGVRYNPPSTRAPNQPIHESLRRGERACLRAVCSSLRRRASLHGSRHSVAMDHSVRSARGGCTRCLSGVGAVGATQAPRRARDSR
jgi:hypothetical protein